MGFHNFVGEVMDSTGRGHVSSVKYGKIIGKFTAEIEILLHKQNGHGFFRMEELERRSDFVAQLLAFMWVFDANLIKASREIFVVLVAA